MTTPVLISILFVLLLLSAFFSGTETALMSINRYRLKHMAREGNRGAQLTERLLQNPDRLIVVILIGNNLVNFSASALVTLLANRMGGTAVAVAVAVFTLVVIIFAEVTPKTLAALHPERVALPSAYIYAPLQRLMYPLVWLVNVFARLLLRMVGIKMTLPSTALSAEELRSVLDESGPRLPRRRHRMLLQILDLENLTVEDVMVPRQEVVGIDLNEDWEHALEIMQHSHHTRLPVYRDNLNQVAGMLHLRRILKPLAAGTLTRKELFSIITEPYFVPEDTPLNKQLMNFQANRKRAGLVVDEYGDIQGMITVEDLLEEIVGKFTSGDTRFVKDVTAETGGTFLVSGHANLRDLNRNMGWDLPTNEAKTINGLITEHLEKIPAAKTKVNIAGYHLHVLRTDNNTIKSVRLTPPLASPGD